jgi:hypothetical protein
MANGVPHPPAASHDEFLARRHSERPLRICPLEAKLTSSFLQVDEDCGTSSCAASSSSSRTAPPAESHDEFLARRQAERAPRVRSLEAKLTSSFLPAECVVRTLNDDASIFAASSSPTAPPTASHDEFLARRHAQRPPRICSIQAKLTSSFGLMCTTNEEISFEPSAVPTSDPASGSSSSHLGATLQRPRSLHRDASWPVRTVNTRARLGSFFRRTCSV